MFNCQFCNRETTTRTGNTNHEKCCPENKNRMVHNWKGKKHSIETKRKIGNGAVLGKTDVKSILDVSSRTTRKILQRMQLACFNCGWDKDVCDVHHIIPKSKGGTDEHSNLTYICPNCHRLAHSNKLLKFVSIEEKVGDAWKANYFFKS